jgi:phage/plasmid-associated DNA primase
MRVNEYRENEDDVEQFISSCCQRVKGAEARFIDLFRAYEDWCQDLAQKPMSSKAFSFRLLRKFDRKKTSLGAVYLGLELNPHIRV